MDNGKLIMENGKRMHHAAVKRRPVPIENQPGVILTKIPIYGDCGWFSNTVFLPENNPHEKTITRPSDVSVCEGILAGSYGCRI
jgi:hypothetical protein